jgi:hypothetical protein
MPKGWCRVEYPEDKLRMNQIIDARQWFSRDRMQGPRNIELCRQVGYMYNY